MSTVLKKCNRGGVPCLCSESAVVSSTTLTITFPIYSNWPHHYTGVMILNVPQTFDPDGVTTINLVVQGESTQLYTHAGKAATEAQVTGPGIYKVFMDSSIKEIRII